MWLLYLVFFPLLLCLLPSCFTFKARKRKPKQEKQSGGDSRTSSISEDLTATRSSHTPTGTSHSTTESILGKKSDPDKQTDGEKEIFKGLKLDKNQIARIKKLSKKDQDNWEKWTRLDLTRELDRADSYYLEHDCKGLRKNNCKGCKDYLKLIRTLRTYQYRYGALCPSTPSNEQQEVALAIKEFEQRAYWFGMIWNKQKFAKINLNEWQDTKAKQIVNNDRKRRHKLKKTIKDWRKAKKKRREEKHKLERKKLAQLKKKEIELKKKKEQKPPKPASSGLIDDGRYESMFDTEEGQQFLTEKTSSQSVVTNCQYESLMDVEVKPGGQRQEAKKPVDDEKYENLLDVQTAIQEAEKKLAAKKKEEKSKPKEEAYESLLELVTDTVSEDQVSIVEKKPEAKKPSEKETKKEDKKLSTGINKSKQHPVKSPDASSFSDDVA